MQIERKLERKQKKKLKKQSEESKRGRRNKSTGRQSENKLVKLLLSNGIKAERIPLSGALGGKYSNDVHFWIQDEEFTIENKRRQQFNRIRKLTTDYGIYIKEVGYFVNQTDFINFINGIYIPQYTECENKGFKTVLNWFAQDGADVVSMDERYKDFLFCISEKAWERIKEIFKEE